MAARQVQQQALTVTPYLAIQGADAAIAFYQKAFGAVEIYRLNDSDGRVSHAEIHIGEAVLFISDEYPEINVFSAQRLGGSPVMIVLNVPDVDATFQQAVAAGATMERPLQDSFDGALRTGKLIDPYQHRWMITTRYTLGG